MATVLTERITPQIALLTMNRPDRLNAMTNELVADLHAALEGVRNDRECRVVILTGAGRGFCAVSTSTAPAPRPTPRAGVRSAPA